MRNRQISVPRAGSLVVAGLGVTWTLVRVTAPLRRVPRPGFDDAVAAAAAWLLVAGAAWGVLICGAVLVEAVSDRRVHALSWVACPPSLRRALVAGLGVALATAPTARAAPSDVAAGPSSTGSSPTRGLPPPARPTGVLGAEQQRVVVRPGDTLWHLAESRLPASVTTAEVVEIVGRWHRRNRGAIGPDPDLVRPGQRLVVPTHHHHESSRHLEEKP